MTLESIAIGSLVSVKAKNPRAQLAGAALCQREDAAPDEVVEVPGLWPGEAASVRILARSRHAPRYFAKLHEISSAHPGRVTPPCVHHPDNEAKPACGGCPWMSLDLDAQRKLKTQVLEDLFGQALTPIQGESGEGYRHASKRVVGRVRGRLSLGSYVPKTHHLAPMQQCRVDHPKLTHAFERCEALLIEHRVAPYDEARKEGEVRYAWGKCGDAGVHITLITANTPSDRLQRALSALALALGPGNAVSWQLHDGPGNAMRSAHPPTRVDAFGALPEIEFLGQKIQLDALGFLQPNPKVAQLCYRALLGLDQDDAPSGTLALDLYAGAGATSLALAERFDTVMACEQRPPDGAAPMVQARSVEEFLADFDPTKHGQPAFVVANPPRSGLSPAACARLVQLQAPRLSIMSCGPAALARNLEQLKAAGYVLDRLEAFDPLPHTAHVELVAQLRFAPTSS